MFIRHLAVAGLLASASAAQAQVIFSDNFNADLLGLNKTTFVGGWTVGNGTVDVIGAGPGSEANAGAGQSGDATGYSFGFTTQGNFIDLDGSGIDSGLFQKMLTLTGGTTYTASFQLAGSQRNFTESAVVTFGTTTATYTYAKSATFTTSVLSFTPTVTGLYALSFNEPGASNLEGLLLDNVTVSAVPVVTAVPEPSTYALMLAGIGAIGFLALRRNRV